MVSFISATDFGLFLLITMLVFVPIAAFAFARSGKGLRELGKGPWAIDRDPAGDRKSDSPATPGPAGDHERVEEIRQMVVAADYRRRSRGEDGIEVEEEVSRLLAMEVDVSVTHPKEGVGDRGAGDGTDEDTHDVVIEIRQLVVANNERRVRRGLEPLDVETEVNRRLEEWT